ncbi:hypothetical protein TNIN_163441 [Trichonephila inaurata madagascariensis]|uniref:Uncharacterized protein n=1 Tax=Trichonephila inaurata madagascariensis TaxID=2747483 RepID=A0A8X6X7C4_9ARAC|nr:hypothetical protein TNIN_163441 [Trichonephila inaurata madagascariensis]
MSLYTLRKMIRKFETIGKLDILLGKGRKPIPSSSIENMATKIVETRSHSPDGSVISWKLTEVIVDFSKLPLNRLICQNCVVNCMIIDDRKFHF